MSTMVTVGNAGLPGSLTISNLSFGAQATGNVTVSNITLVPSCGSGSLGNDCPTGSADPEVFALPSVAAGEFGTACAGQNFSVTVVNPTTGRVSFVASTPVVLGPPGGPADMCRIDFTFDVLKTPVQDSQPGQPGIQTTQLASAMGQHTDGSFASAFGTGTVTVNRATPTITATASPGGPSGTVVSDDVAVMGVSNAPLPTGTVAFDLFNDINCTTRVFNSVGALNGPSQGHANSGPFAASSGTYHWRATYSGDANFQAVGPGPCSDPAQTVTIGPQNTTAPAPANDARSSATVLSGMAGTDTGTTVYATHTSDEPAASCGSADRFVWFRQTITTAGDTVNVDTVGSNFDTVLAVFKDNGAGGLSPVVCGDDSYSSVQSSVSFAATPGTYYYGVGSFTNATSGFVRLNHDFGIPLPTGTSSRSTVPATSNVPNSCGGGGAVPDRWYRFIGTGSSMAIDTFGSSYDTILTALTFPGPTAVTCNDDTGGLQSQVTFTAQLGQRYYVLVSGFNGATGTQTLHVNGTVGSGAPATPAAPSAPVAPTGAVATAAPDGSIALSWTGPSEADNFQITRGSAESSATTLAYPGPAVRNFTDTAPGTGIQDYWLYAVNGSGRSPAAHVAAVPRSATTTQVTPSSNPSEVTSGVTLTANVTANDASGSPAGTVTFFDGATTLGMAALSSGTAVFPTSSLAPGSHALTAMYAGNSVYASSTSPVLTQQVEFSDVRSGAPFYSDIYWLTDHKIATGFPDGTFRPTNDVTRQAFAAYLYRYAHSGADAGTCTTGTSSFSDVPDSSQFCGDIKWLASSGITGGFPDGTFRPTLSIARQAIAAFLYRFNHAGADAGQCATGASSFNDVPDTSAFCGDIKWLASTTPVAITGGFPDGTFRPTSFATRQAVAAYFHRYNADYGS